MPPYKIQYDDNVTWYLVDSGTLVTVPSDGLLPPGFDPYSEKMFNQDIIDIGENGEVVRVASLLRNQKSISGVLVLEGNKAYGKAGKRMLYKCIPDDRRLPSFLVAYSLDVSCFSKKFVNKYVVFKYKEWNGEKPVGELVVTIGDVNVLENFYEYQLYCKNLNASIQDFVAETKKRLGDGGLEIEKRIISEYSVEDRRDWGGIFTIDPVGSKDFDDAFGLSASGVDGCVRLSVYISNVALWMDALKLWTSFSQRISTIYLPDRKRPMLPSVLSDILCSLLEKKERFAFTMDVDVCENTGEIVGNVVFKNTAVVVERNFRYDEPDLDACNVYQRALRLVQKMAKDDVNDSHDFVAYIMILMNYKCAVRFVESKNGIYRSFKFKSGLDFPDGMLPKNVMMSLKTWHSNGSSYIKYDGDGEKVHEMMKFNEYVHITSPIRRLVDLLNIIQLMDNEGLVAMTGDMLAFYEHWTSDESLAYINQSMRSIRKVQNDCALLAMCVTKPEVMERIYTGYVFEAMERNDGLWLYVVYVPELKLSSKFIYYNKMDLYSEHRFKIYLFEDKDALKKKIRMEKM